MGSLALLQHPDEEPEEHEGGDSGGGDIGNGLGQEYGEGLVGEEQGEKEDQRDQQDDLSQQCHDQADLGLPQSHEGLLAGKLEADGEAAGQEDPQCPGSIFHQCRIAGEDTGENLGENHQQQPEGGGIGDADTELAEEGFLHPVELLGAVVIADERLAALADTGQGHGDQLVDGGQHRHGTNGHVAAEPGQGGGEADGQDALGGNHDEAGDTQTQTGQDDGGDQLHILHLQPQDGLLSRKEPEDPDGADSLAQHGGGCGTGNAHVQHENENGIQNNVDDSADDGGQHTDLGKALGSDKGVHAHDGQHKYAAQNVDPGIFHGVGQGHIRGAEPPQQGGGGKIEYRGQQYGQQHQHSEAVAQNFFCPVLVALSHGNGCPGSAAGTCQHGGGGDQHEDGGEEAHAGEGGAADFGNVADVDPVNDVVEQVDDLSHQCGNRHLHHQFFDAAGSHVLFCCHR